MNRWQRFINKEGKIYILPTGHGLVFLLGIFVMIMTGATYSNNLIYLLAFVLFSIVMVSMVQTHNNLKKVEVRLIHIEEGFAGETARLDLRLGHGLKVFRQKIRVGLAKNEIFTSAGSELDFLPPQGAARLQLPFKTSRRGVFSLPNLVLETNYPIGLFRAWKTVRLDAEVFVYPALKGHRHLPLGRGYKESGETQKLSQGVSQEMDFKEHRPYREGESFRHIDWKIAARRGILLTKTFEGERDQILRFVYNSSQTGQEREDKLSQLAVWIHEAFKKGSSFELILPEKRLEAGADFYHYKASLRELARFEERPA